MKTRLALILCGSLVFVPRTSAQELTVPPGATVAYVSGSRLSVESAPGKEGQARVRTLQQQRATELRTRQQTLEATRQKLALMTEDAERVPLQQQELVQRGDLERATAQAQADIQALQREINTELQAKVKAELDELLKGTSIQVVVQFETSIIWSVPGLDMTTAVIQRLNRRAAATPAK